MCKVLRKIDRVGKEFKFTIAGEDSFTTGLGGIITIINYIGIIALFGFFGQELFIRQNPNFIKREDIAEKNTFISLNQSNFFIALSVTDNFNNPIFDNKYFEAELFYTDFKYGVIKNSIVDYVNCSSLDNFPKELNQDQFKGNYCFNINHLAGGYWMDDTLTTLAFNIRRCNNLTQAKYNITCATDNEVKAISGGAIFLNYVYLNRVIQPQNFNYPIKIIKKYSYDTYNIDKKAVFNYEIFYNRANLNTDSGIIFESNNNTINYVELDYLRSFNGNIDYMGDYVVSLQIFVSEKINYYSRSYIRLQDVIANVMAFMDLIMILIKLIYGFYLDDEYSVYLYKTLFKLYIEDELNFESNTIYKPDRLNIIPFNMKKNSNNINKEEVELTNLKELPVNLDNQSEAKRQLQYNSQTNPDLNNDNYANISIKSVKDKFPDEHISVNENIDNNDDNIIKNNSPYINIDYNKDFKTIDVNKHKHKSKKAIEINLKERCDLIKCPCFKKNITTEDILKQELILSADEIIAKKTDLFNLWKSLDQMNIIKKMLLNENQRYMLNQIGLKGIVISNKLNKESKEDLKSDLLDIKNIEEEKNEVKKLNLIEYYKQKSDIAKENDIDNLLWQYLEDDIKKSIQEEISKS